MRFLGRSRSEELPQPPVSAIPEGTVHPESSESDLQSIDPLEFITSHEDALVESHGAWRAIARTITAQEEDFHYGIQRGLADVWHMARPGQVLEDTILENETERLSQDIQVYNMLAARYVSSLPPELITSDVIGKYFYEIPDKTVNYILKSDYFPTSRFIPRQVRLAHDMAKADMYGSAILADLLDLYSRRPEDFADMARLFDEGAAEADPKYAELQQIIAADWYAPDPAHSLTRNFITFLQGNDGVFKQGFSELVANESKNPRLLTVRNMARFAVLAAHGNPDDPAVISGVLAQTYDAWEEIPEIKSSFQGYVRGAAERFQSQIQSIAGQRTARSIRLIPTEEQIIRMRNNFGAKFLPNRTAKRQHNRQADRTFNANQLPALSDIDAMAAEAETIRERTFLKANQTPDGLSYQEMTVDELAYRFVPKNQPHTAEDVKKMLAWLQRNPVSSASTMMVKLPKIQYDHRPFPVRRFSPNRLSALEMHPDSRRWRIVYALAENAIIIQNILHHSDFDSAYS